MSKRLPKGISMEGKKYRARVSYLGTQYQVGTYYTLADAKAALALARSQIAINTFRSPVAVRREMRENQEKQASIPTLREWSMIWLDEQETSGRVAEGTVITRRSSLNAHVLPVLGNKRLNEITSNEIHALIDGLRNKSGTRGGTGQGGAWRNAALALRACLNAAVQSPLIPLDASPFNYVIPKTTKSALQNAYEAVTPEKIEKIKGLMPEHLRIAVDLAAWCALRSGEVLGLQYQDIGNLDQPGRVLIHVRRQLNAKAGKLTGPKAGSQRVVAVPETIASRLRSHLEKYNPEPSPESHLVCSPRKPGARVSQTTLDNHWRNARDKVLPGLKFHDLRKFGLTVFAQSGATVREVMSRGGHRDTDVAFQYQFAELDRDIHLASRMNNLIAEGNDND